MGGPSRFDRFRARPRRERLLLLEALAALALARVATFALPFRRLARLLGEPGLEGPWEGPPPEQVAGIPWAVAAMARYIPWDGRCLTRAVAGWMMLARRGLAGTVYFGVAEAPGRPGRKLFHAWLRCGSCFVTGGEGHLRFQVLACFSRRPREEKETAHR